MSPSDSVYRKYFKKLVLRKKDSHKTYKKGDAKGEC